MLHGLRRTWATQMRCHSRPDTRGRATDALRDRHKHVTVGEEAKGADHLSGRPRLSGEALENTSRSNRADSARLYPPYSADVFRHLPGQLARLSS